MLTVLRRHGPHWTVPYLPRGLSQCGSVHGDKNDVGVDQIPMQDAGRLQSVTPALTRFVPAPPATCVHLPLPCQTSLWPMRASLAAMSFMDQARSFWDPDAQSGVVRLISFRGVIDA
jgi:hypothetical protein